MTRKENAGLGKEVRPTDEEIVRNSPNEANTSGGEKVDLRILKSKKGLKSALRQLLEEKSFDQINTSEICERAMSSRITFYKYYGDKYTLLNDLLKDMEQEFENNYEELQETSVLDDPTTAFENLLICLLHEYSGINNIIDHVSRYKDDVICFPCFGTVSRLMEDLIYKYADILKPNYNSKKLSVSIVFAIYGFLLFSDVKSDEKWRQEQKYARKLLRDLINSDLFTLTAKKN